MRKAILGRRIGLMVLVLGACGSSGDAGPDAMDPNRVTLSGAVFDFAALTPIEGVEVCLFEDTTTPCDTSDANGRYAITSRKNVDVLVQYTAPGYFTKLRHRRVANDNEDLTLFNLQTTVRVAEQFARVSVTPDAAKGHLAIQIYGTIAGSTATLVPAMGEGPFYAGPNEDLDPALTGATEAGLGAVAFANVPVGSYSIVVSAQDATCTSREAPGVEAQSSLARSVAGVITETFIDCE